MRDGENHSFVSKSNEDDEQTYIRLDFCQRRF